MDVGTNALLTPTTAFLYSCLNITPQTPRQSSGEDNPFDRAFKASNSTLGQTVQVETPTSLYNDSSIRRGSSSDGQTLNFQDVKTIHQFPDTPPLSASIERTSEIQSFAPQPQLRPQSPALEPQTKPQEKKRTNRKRKAICDEDKMNKRAAFLERNRVAAGKCRTRKKDWVGKLEEDARLAQAINEELKREVQELTEMVRGLRELATRCDDECALAKKGGEICEEVIEEEKEVEGEK